MWTDSSILTSNHLWFNEKQQANDSWQTDPTQELANGLSMFVAF